MCRWVYMCLSFNQRGTNYVFMAKSFENFCKLFRFEQRFKIHLCKLPCFSEICFSKHDLGYQPQIGSKLKPLGLRTIFSFENTLQAIVPILKRMSPTKKNVLGTCRSIKNVHSSLLIRQQLNRAEPAKETNTTVLHQEPA